MFEKNWKTNRTQWTTNVFEQTWVQPERSHSTDWLREASWTKSDKTMFILWNKSDKVARVWQSVCKWGEDCSSHLRGVKCNLHCAKKIKTITTFSIINFFQRNVFCFSHCLLKACERPSADFIVNFYNRFRGFFFNNKFSSCLKKTAEEVRNV